MKKALFILAKNNFRDLEYLVCRDFLEYHKVSVSTASLSNVSLGRFGVEVKSDFLIDTVSFELLNIFDTIVFIGGSGVLDYIGHYKLRDLIIQYLENPTKIGAAICAAPRVLMAWGLLGGKTCVGNDWDANFETLCKTHNASNAKGESVFKDGNIITATGPESSELFALEIIKSLQYNS